MADMAVMHGISADDSIEASDTTDNLGHSLLCPTGVAAIQLDRRSPQVVGKVAHHAAGCPVKIATIGGISISNAKTYAGAGAHILITSGPYSAKPKGVSAILEPN